MQLHYFIISLFAFGHINIFKIINYGIYRFNIVIRARIYVAQEHWSARLYRHCCAGLCF